MQKNRLFLGSKCIILLSSFYSQNMHYILDCSIFSWCIQQHELISTHSFQAAVPIWFGVAIEVMRFIIYNLLPIFFAINAVRLMTMMIYVLVCTVQRVNLNTNTIQRTSAAQRLVYSFAFNANYAMIATVATCFVAPSRINYGNVAFYWCAQHSMHMHFESIFISFSCNYSMVTRE